MMEESPRILLILSNSEHRESKLGIAMTKDHWNRDRQSSVINREKIHRDELHSIPEARLYNLSRNFMVEPWFGLTGFGVFFEDKSCDVVRGGFGRVVTPSNTSLRGGFIFHLRQTVTLKPVQSMHSLPNQQSGIHFRNSRLSRATTDSNSELSTWPFPDSAWCSTQ